MNRKLANTGTALINQLAAVIAGLRDAIEERDATILRRDREIASLRRRLEDAERMAPANAEYRVGLGL